MARSLLLLLLASLTLLAAEKPPKFAEHVLATDLRGGYQTIAVDLNHDGKLDLIGLASGVPDLVWFENPTWERHVLAGGFTQLINLAAYDTDGDGIPEIVVASGFGTTAAASKGIVTLLKHNGDPRQPWTATEIDRLPTMHRMRVADIDGSGKKVFIGAPLAGEKATAPDYREKVQLVMYKPGEWKRIVISEENEGVQHGVTVIDWDGNGREGFLSASFSGIHLFRFGKDNQWTRTEISKGSPAAWPKSGSSDTAVGMSGKDRFIAAIEPWHGNQIAVYNQDHGQWVRKVIDDTFADGHTILTADLNGDGHDEIVASMRGNPRQAVIFYETGDREHPWAKEILDNGGMAGAGCFAADLNGDKRIDIACIGTGTMNLKWYENLGK